MTLLNLLGRYSCYDGIVPDARLVAFPRHFDSWYSVADRAWWGEDSARESRLRWRRVDDFFHMWHSTELFSVPSAARRGLYPGLPSDWPSLEAPEYLCVPTPSTLAYVAAHWLPRGRAESAEAEHTRGLVRAILLSEWAVTAFLCFLRASLEGMPFFTKCPDPRLLARRDEPIGERGMLFRLSAGLIAFIRSVGVAEILEGTAFDATDAEQLLTFPEGMDWSGRTSCGSAGTDGVPWLCPQGPTPRSAQPTAPRPSTWPTRLTQSRVLRGRSWRRKHVPDR